MTEQEQIDALKAQVNYLREVLDGLAKLGNGEHYGNSIGNSIAARALEFTPEQCLAEVKAKAIEDALFYADHIGSNGNGYDYAEEDLQAYADQLRGSKRNEQNP